MTQVNELFARHSRGWKPITPTPEDASAACFGVFPRDVFTEENLDSLVESIRLDAANSLKIDPATVELLGSMAANDFLYENGVLVLYFGAKKTLAPVVYMHEGNLTEIEAA